MQSTDTQVLECIGIEWVFSQRYWHILKERILVDIVFVLLLSIFVLVMPFFLTLSVSFVLYCFHALDE